MTSSEKKIALEKILFERRDRFMRVSEFRDVLLAANEFKGMDKAKLRRWIYSHFLTMQKKGRLEQRMTETNKRVYRLIAVDSDENNLADISREPCINLEGILNELAEQLIDKQRESRIFLSELSTYKRMQQRYPELRQYAKEKYQSTFDESYKLLGQIKAIEATLSDHGRGVISCH